MIHGYQPNGYFATSTGDGVKIEGETRQCVHCQKIWTYRPGSGTVRGWCFKHQGFVCAEPECMEQQKVLVGNYERVTGKVVSCLAFEEWVDFQAEQWAKVRFGAAELTVTDAGLIIPKERT